MEKELKPSATAKDLGITWDTRLTYDNHITNIVSSSMKALLQINRVRHLFSSEILVKIINSLVFSKLYYCSSVWASTSVTNVKKIQCSKLCRTTTGQRSFTYRAINIGNTPCSSLKQPASIDNFKRRLKKQLLECFLDPN